MWDDHESDEDDQPMTDEHHDDHSSLPPMAGATGAEVLQAALPLIVRAASESAAAATRSATTQANVEARLTEFKTSLDNNTSAILRWVEAKEKENNLREAQINAQNEGNKRWHETLRALVTPQVVITVFIQLATLFAMAFGIYNVMPAPATLQGAELPAVHRPGAP